MPTPLGLGLAGVQVAAAPPKAPLRQTALFVASPAFVLVIAVPPLLGSFLDGGQALGISPDELKVLGTALVIAGSFFVGYIAQSRTAKKPPAEPIDVDEIVESLRAFEENEAFQRERRQTLSYDEFRLRD